MTRLTLAACLMALPVAALAQGSEEKVDPADLAADALFEKVGGPQHIRGLELSPVYGSGGHAVICATSNAHDANGNFIGLTYWQMTFNADRTEVTSVRNVTGLFSDCYSESYKTHRN
ncbi:hypothetical protein [Sedimentitalea nanhaiensis]|uniref:Uncharacterized protein n=1 Tax=Sedimentitalea nanhaiensis TaxID=999627 RepID=A0A1I7B5H1_9RHOB|nr:hypothetical protein [Sedimentitalea nanhaiensis]SFT82449.1 hypothetical protein SAMN05216236_108159 [Sedimentitalea nanhaiensis]